MGNRNRNLTAIIFIAAICILILTSCAGTKRPVETADLAIPPTAAETPGLEDENAPNPEYLEIFETVWNIVNERFYDPNFNGIDWDDVYVEYKPQVAAVKDGEAFYLLLNQMCYEIGVSHFFLLPGDALEQLDPVVSAPGTVGFDIRIINNQIVVTDVLPGMPAEASGIRPGFIIQEIDDHPMEIADQLVTIWIPPFNERSHRARITSAIQTLLFGEVGENVKVSFLDENDHSQEVTLTRVERHEQPITGEGFPTLYAGYEYKTILDGIGYLRFNGFLPQVLDGVLEAIRELNDARGLIIDLRGNPGGVYPVRKAIASQFFDESVLLWNYIIRHGLDLEGFETDAYAEPPNDPYLGPVVVLVDELCASSCEEFSGALQANQRAAIIGGWTSGSDLVMDVVILSNGASFGYPIAQTQTLDGRVLEGNGVIPDMEVRLDRELLLRGVDSQLQAAVEFLANQLEE